MKSRNWRGVIMPLVAALRPLLRRRATGSSLRAKRQAQRPPIRPSSPSTGVATTSDEPWRSPAVNPENDARHGAFPGCRLAPTRLHQAIGGCRRSIRKAMWRGVVFPATDGSSGAEAAPVLALLTCRGAIPTAQCYSPTRYRATRSSAGTPCTSDSSCGTRTRRTARKRRSISSRYTRSCALRAS